MIVWVLVAAAAVLLLWPSTKASPQPAHILPAAPPEPSKRHPSYLDSVQALQVVRARLAYTQHLGEPQQEACNVLTLALSEGSEK
jgi:hypothetical protein